MSSQSIDILLAQHPVFASLFRLVCALVKTNEVLSSTIAAYISRYLKQSGMELPHAFRIYESFIRDYDKDIRLFHETGKYPFELTGTIRDIDRLFYDVALLLSYLVAAHRYRIINCLYDKTKADGKALFVGCGPGAEIDLVKPLFEEIHAFDMSLNPLLQELMPDVNFHQETFPSDDVRDEFEAIYLIEILEHLEDPYQLLKSCRDALSGTGRLHLTTATNIPQFDHIYNFPHDHSEFEERIGAMGLKVISNDEIGHKYMTADIAAKNHYYVLVRQ
uniref:Methyltransferase domain-containing protein n=1 Tax=Candidatus Kentrum sp. FW TaxID=2126338 RepID=A0A450TUZ0_9GAMM|nr:MAG: Methyltransferase domain-containing protein [Candidatus Kentron sp. FW]